FRGATEFHAIGRDCGSRHRINGTAVKALGPYPAAALAHQAAAAGAVVSHAGKYDDAAALPVTLRHAGQYKVNGGTVRSAPAGIAHHERTIRQQLGNTIY